MNRNPKYMNNPPNATRNPNPNVSNPNDSSNESNHLCYRHQSPSSQSRERIEIDFV